jgi:hypothetical protein
MKAVFELSEKNIPLLYHEAEDKLLLNWSWSKKYPGRK